MAKKQLEIRNLKNKCIYSTRYNDIEAAYTFYDLYLDDEFEMESIIDINCEDEFNDKTCHIAFGVNELTLSFTRLKSFLISHNEALSNDKSWALQVRLSPLDVSQEVQVLLNAIKKSDTDSLIPVVVFE